MTDAKELIARRVAREFKEGDVVNLGIGLPTLVANYVDPSLSITLQSENGFTGIGPMPPPGQENPYIVNAGGVPVTIQKGGATFDSAQSFAMIRGGHVDMCVLGALQVSERGDIASWMIPGEFVPGMGGAMDLVVGARNVIIAMLHTAKGKPRIVKECSLPLTAEAGAHLIITEMCVLRVTPQGLMMTEINPHYTPEQIQSCTEPRLSLSPVLAKMRLD